jgi:carbon monoxide dehydrogenase subunit G
MKSLQARSQSIIKAPVAVIWSLITDIDQLHKVNPGVAKASGRMDKVGETRRCEIDNNGRKGTMVEKMIELIPERKTVWTIESDTMGMSGMLRNTRFVFNLEKISEKETKVVSETWYDPANFIASLMNKLVMRRMISKAQEKILANIKTITEK